MTMVIRVLARAGKEKEGEEKQMGKFVDLVDGYIVEGVGEIPGEIKIFKNDHVDYVDMLMGEILLNDLKGQLLNILEGIGLPERQEKALKRQMVNVLHETRRQIKEDLELVKAE